MGSNFSSWSTIIICVLLVLLIAKGNKKITIMQWKEMGNDANHGLQQHLDQTRKELHEKENQKGQDLQQSNSTDNNNPLIKHVSDDHDQEHSHGHPSSSSPPPHMHHMDPSVHIFFTINDIKIGKTIPIYFSNKDASTSPHLLSRQEADSIPFSLSKLSYLLEFFSFSNYSSQAKAMEYTLTQCEVEPMKGETKLCATSLESMLDFVHTTFGLDSLLKALTTHHLTKPMTPLQNYTILEEPKEILAPKVMGCHTMPYPYIVYFCHTQEGGTKLFEILLGGEHEERVQALTVCHLDTSQWGHDSPAFRLLNTQPGTSPVCHIFPADNLVWVPLPP